MFELLSDTITKEPVTYRHGTRMHKAVATRKETTTCYNNPVTGALVRKSAPSKYPGISMTDRYHFYTSPTRAKLVTFAEGSKMKNMGIDQILLEVSNEGKLKRKKLSFISNNNIIRDFDNLCASMKSIKWYLKFMGDLAKRNVKRRK